MAICGAQRRTVVARPLAVQTCDVFDCSLFAHSCLKGVGVANGRARYGMVSILEVNCSLSVAAAGATGPCLCTRWCAQVSEGIDFADGRARCVMVVGIPYPHFKDSKVALKKQYNNDTANASQRAAAAARRGPYGGGGSSSGGGPPRLLTGEAWYSQQAFRALNQVGDL